MTRQSAPTAMSSPGLIVCLAVLVTWEWFSAYTIKSPKVMLVV